MPRTILVPLDGSAEAARAIPYAALLARRFGAGCRLLLVRPAQAPRGTQESAAGVTALQAAEVYLRATAAPLVQAGFDVTTLCPYGSLTESIVHDAEIHGADLIVAATHGRWGVDRLLHGSIAGEILHDSPVPVMFVGPNVGAPTQLRRMLVPLDGEPFSAAILPPVSDLSAALSVPVNLVGIVPPLFVPINDSEGQLPSWTLERMQLRRAGNSYAMQRSNPEVQHQLAALDQSLQFWARQLTTVAAEPEVHTYYGTHGPSIASTIIHAAAERGADLIALRSHARPPVTRLFMGSVADELVRTSPLPSLLFTSRTLPQTAGAGVELEHHAIAV